LACDTSIFAAIGPVSGTQLDPCRSPHPLSVMTIHGTKDPLVPYGGGPGRGFAHINGPPVVAVLRRASPLSITGLVRL
jgi:polyhydroxybutyrate depolymerase